MDSQANKGVPVPTNELPVPPEPAGGDYMVTISKAEFWALNDLLDLAKKSLAMFAENMTNAYSFEQAVKKISEIQAARTEKWRRENK